MAMPHLAAVVIAGLALAFCVPAVGALVVPATGPVPLVASPAQPGSGVQGDAASLVPPAVAPILQTGSGLIPVTVEVQATAQVEAGSPAATEPTPQAGSSEAARSPSLGEEVAAVAVPAAGATLVAVLFASLAFGIDAVRSAQARLSSQLGRIGRALLGLGAAIPLFSRIEQGNVMQNAVRARVHEAVVQDPGLSLSEVRARTGIAWGTAVHHLRRLEQHGKIVSVTQLAHRRFFAANSVAAGQRTAVAVVAHPTARRIAHLVNGQPGLDQTAICEALGINNPAASKHLRHFASEGLVITHRDGRRRLYTPTPSLQSVLLVLEPAATAARMPRVLASSTAPVGAWVT